MLERFYQTEVVMVPTLGGGKVPDLEFKLTCTALQIPLDAARPPTNAYTLVSAMSPM